MLRLTLRRDLDVLDGIAFGRGGLFGMVREGDRVDVAARLVEPAIRRVRVPPAGRDRCRGGADGGRGTIAVSGRILTGAPTSRTDHRRGSERDP